ncbi:TPA: HNH endonuclease [Citrobacter braakii]|nr:HNH endonuclease [Citrobacter braakii]HEF0004762.1 HNH endonuclease [Citrobacter braakii]HEF0035351.1 HNH endonuclease [Citrobacter braakii]
MKSIYNDMHKVFFTQICKGKTLSEVTDAFNYHFNEQKSKHAIRAVLCKWGIHKSLAKQVTYSDEQLTFLYINRNLLKAELTVRFNEKFGTNKSLGNIKDTLRLRGWGNGGSIGHKNTKRRMIRFKGKLVRLDVYVWECVNGPLPEGYTIIHLDNNYNNNSISNLKLAPVYIRAAYMRAGYGDVPEILAPALYAQILLKDTIKKLSRK